MKFAPATKKQAKLRLAIVGPSGSGKTYSALSIATGLGQKIAVIDTEHGSASLYADKFRFDVCNLDTFSPEAYVEALKEAEAAGYEVVIIDSLSHAWMGKDGALEQVDNATRRSGSKNSYFAWRDVTPKHNEMVEAIIQSKAHVIATMRAKTEYTTDKDDRGKVTPRKIGLAPIQRDGMEYEFTVSGDLDLEHNYNITKTRCSTLAGKVIQKPGLELAKTLKAWLEGGAPEAPKPEFKSQQTAPAPLSVVKPVTEAQLSKALEDGQREALAMRNPALASITPPPLKKVEVVDELATEIAAIQKAIKDAPTAAAVKAIKPRIERLPESEAKMLKSVAAVRHEALAKAEKAAKAVV